MTRVGVAVASISALMALPALAVDVSSFDLDTVNDILTVTTAGGKVWSYDYTDDLPLDQAGLDKIRDLAQSDLFDTDTARGDLLADDPDRLVDPANECSSWYERTKGPPSDRPRILARSTVVVAAFADANGDPYLELRSCDPARAPL